MSRGLITRSEARSLGAKRYFTGKQCPHGHIDYRLVSDFSCTECNRIKTKRYLKANPHIAKKRIKRHYESYPHKELLKTANRRAAKDDRTPDWLDLTQLAEVETAYMYCRALRDIGLKMAVDHIVPLRGTAVSGLHVPWNLQVIHEVENSMKGNKYA